MGLPFEIQNIIGSSFLYKKNKLFVIKYLIQQKLSFLFTDSFFNG
jgi:hypothetical protein